MERSSQGTPWVMQESHRDYNQDGWLDRYKLGSSPYQKPIVQI